MRIFASTIAILLTLWGVANSEVIKSSSLQASSDGVNITIRFITEDESSVARFDLERRTDNETGYTTIASLDPKGPSLYEYVDRSAFKKITTMYHYRIKISYSNGAMPIYTVDLPVSHTVSGVRRTWGSIKAMFRY
ncbi:MAG TPA: hypothetical protein VES59_06430 [Bacteroidota bacterium]|nr:hypothetical protein [Bacteroidota bacterium]